MRVVGECVQIQDESGVLLVVATVDPAAMLVAPRIRHHAGCHPNAHCRTTPKRTVALPTTEPHAHAALRHPVIRGPSSL